MKHFKLCVNVVKKKLVQQEYFSAPIQMAALERPAGSSQAVQPPANQQVPHSLPGSLPQAAGALLQKFPEVVITGTTHPHPLYGISHSIKTTGRPVFAKARRLDPEKLQCTKTEF